MDKSLKLEIKLPVLKDIELLAVEGLELMGKHLSISEEKVGEARMLIVEGVINAIEHSQNITPYVDVHLIMSTKILTIIIEDYGKGFDPTSIQEPDISEKLKSDYKRGWGLKLIKELSDDLKINSSNEGTRVTITKNLN